MKSLLTALVCTFLFTASTAHATPMQTPPVNETENGFVTAGKNYCKDHKLLYGVVVESRDSFIGKKGDGGKFVQTKASEIVILILCNDDYIFYLTGPSIDSLTLTIVKPTDENSPKKSNKLMF